MKSSLLILCILLLVWMPLNAQDLISRQAAAGAFAIADESAVTALYVDPASEAVVKKAAALLQADVERVTGRQPSLLTTLPARAARLIIIGTAGRATVINRLVATRKLSVSPLTGQWEAYQWQRVKSPLPGIDEALVITGSDARGTAYGVMEVSKQIGVSPWYWWADVPVAPGNTLYLTQARLAVQKPAVKYRGLFINDEAPALSGWSREKFGGFNHRFYDKVFELMLRLRANYIWPAMWGNAFYDDDSLNIQVAREYAMVIGTSHHEPLMRAHDEWRRYGQGKWNYDSNATRLKAFWRGGLQRASNEKIVTVGMRGDGDEPMSRETATALLERIVKDQRQLIQEVTGQPASQTPQLWALYKEVQDYYDKGMRVPDDVTLLLCDDNWGNIRRLPKLTDKPRKGGYGIYYHFDYVGGPRNYKWLNTNPIARVWEQMHLAWEYKAREIWIVNVGDIKPMEFPLSFFLDYAWNPAAIGAADLQAYTERWAAQQFGPEHAKDIARLLTLYTQYNGRRKSELLDQHTYHITNYAEAGRIMRQWEDLLYQAQRLARQLPTQYQDAYYQLVWHPIKACTNLQALYHNVAWNKKEADRQEASANDYADAAKKAYEQDSLITLEYHRLNNGKWNHLMSQTHIGYTYWQQPEVNRMPEVTYLPADDNRRFAPVTPDSRSARDQVPANSSGHVFYELDGVVSMEAPHYTKAVNGPAIRWTELPGHGRTGSAITPFPVTTPVQKPGGNSPHLQYEFYTYSQQPVTIAAYFSPTLNLHKAPAGLQYAISIDDEQPQVISINKDDDQLRTWEQWVANNTILKKTNHALNRPGKHVLKYWMVNPAVVLQKLVIDLGGLKPSYLGPPETRRE